MTYKTLNNNNNNNNNTNIIINNNNITNNNNNSNNNNNNTKHTLAGFSDYPEHCVSPSTQHRLTHTLCQAHARQAHAHTKERSAAA